MTRQEIMNMTTEELLALPEDKYQEYMHIRMDIAEGNLIAKNYMDEVNFVRDYLLNESEVA